VPIPNDAVRVSMLGVGPGSEQWDVSFWLNGAAPTGAIGANELAVAIREAWKTTARTAHRALISNDMRWSEFRVYSYPLGGPKAQAIGSALIDTADGTGSAAVAQQPLQSCIVATLLTGLAGRRFRGRMYLPATGLLMQSTHLLAASDATTQSSAMANFFGAVNALSTVGNVVVMSQTAGSSTPVTTIRVDNKVDIQRRRANKLAPTSVVNNTVTQ
jgi:hypothetical protein